MIMGKGDADTNIEEAVQNLLCRVDHDKDIVCYTDGSAEDGTKNGGAGAVVYIPGQEEMLIHRACGTICSSFRAEMMAIEMVLEAVLLNLDPDIEFNRTLWLITDSQSSVSAISQGPGNYLDKIGNNIWSLISKLNERSLKIVFQWVPGHKGIPGNEAADRVAGEASKLPQEEVPINFETVKASLKRHIQEAWLNRIQSQDLYYNKVTGAKPKLLAPSLDRADEVLIHQLRRESLHWQLTALLNTRTWTTARGCASPDVTPKRLLSICLHVLCTKGNEEKRVGFITTTS